MVKCGSLIQNLYLNYVRFNALQLVLLIRTRFQNKNMLMTNLYDNIDSYFRMIGGYSLISIEREKELSLIIQYSWSREKIDKAKEEMITANLRLVISCASGYLTRYHGSLTLIDLIAEGNIGLISAVNGYDFFHARSVPFAGYAGKAISRRIERAIRSDQLIHIPDHHIKYRLTLKDLEIEYGDKLTDDIIVEKLGITAEALVRIRTGGKSAYVTSLEDIGVDGQDWQDIISDDKDIDHVSNQVHSNDLLESLNIYLNVLNAKQKTIIEEMHLNPSPPTYRELGRRLGISPERIRQIHIRGLRILRLHIINDWNQKFNVNTKVKSSYDGFDQRMSFLRYDDPEYFYCMAQQDHERKAKEANKILLYLLKGN